jgi:hypothetical protein
MKDNQHEQLFSELTPAEAAVVEGGLRLTIDRIQAIRAGADPIGADDTYITVNGTKIWGDYSMTTGQTRSVNRGYGLQVLRHRFNFSTMTPGQIVMTKWEDLPQATPQVCKGEYE